MSLLDGATTNDAERLALGHALWRFDDKERAAQVLAGLTEPEALAIVAFARLDTGANVTDADIPPGPWGALVRGELAYAEENLDRALAYYTEAEADPATRPIALLRGATALNLQFLDVEVEPQWARAFEILDREMPPGHGLIGEACIGLAAARNDDEPLYARALHILSNALGADHRRVAEVRERWASCYRIDRRPVPGEPAPDSAPIGWAGIGRPPMGAGPVISAANADQLRAVARFAERAHDVVAHGNELVIAHACGVSIVGPDLAERRLPIGSIHSACAVGVDHVVAIDSGRVWLWHRDGTFVRCLVNYEAYGFVRAVGDNHVVCGKQLIGIDGSVRALPISGERSPVVSADGKRIAFAGRPVQVLDVATGNITDVADDAPAVAWIADELVVSRPDYVGGGLVHGDNTFAQQIHTCWELAAHEGLLYTAGSSGVLGVVVGTDVRALRRVHRTEIRVIAATDRLVATLSGGLLRLHAIADLPPSPLTGPLPEGARVRFGVPAPWHAAPVVEQRDADPNDLVITVGADGIERTWDAAPRELVATRVIGPAHPGPEGVPIIDGRAVESTACVFAIAACAGRVAVALSRTPGAVSVHLYASDGSLIQEWDEGRHYLSCLAFAPDGALAWCADALVIDGQRVPLPWRQSENLNLPSTFAFSPSGDRLAIGGAYWGFVRVLAWPSGERLHDLPMESGYPGSLAWSPDGRYLAWCNAGTTAIWDGERVRVLEDHAGGPSALTFSPKGDLFVSGGRDNSMLVYDVPSFSLRHRLEGHEDGINAVAFGPSGVLASAGALFKTDGVRLWDPHAGIALAVLHEGSAMGACAWDGERLLVGGRRPDVLAYEPAWLAARARPAHAPPRECTYALVGRQGYVAVWGSPKSFEAHELGIGLWDHDKEEHGYCPKDKTVTEALSHHSYGPTWAPAVAAACDELCADARSFYLLYDHAWDAEPGPCPRAPHVIYLGSFPFQRSPP